MTDLSYDGDPRETLQRFRDLTNLSPAEYAEWLRTPESAATADEDVPRERVLDLLDRATGDRLTGDDLDEEQLALMDLVAERIETIRSENPEGDQTRLDWRWRLMHVGHDPLRPEDHAS